MQQWSWKHLRERPMPHLWVGVFRAVFCLTVTVAVVFAAMGDWSGIFLAVVMAGAFLTFPAQHRRQILGRA